MRIQHCREVALTEGSDDHDNGLAVELRTSGDRIGSSERGTGQVDTVTNTNTGSSAVTRYVRVLRWSGGTGSTNGKYTVKVQW